MYDECPQVEVSRKSEGWESEAEKKGQTRNKVQDEER